MQAFISVILLNFFAIFLFKKFNLHPATALLSALFGALSWAMIAALLNQLFVGTALFFGIAFIAFIYLLHKKQNIKDYFSPSVICVNFTSFLFLAIYALQNPLFYYWDEYSLWGTAAKIAKESHMLQAFVPQVLENFKYTPGGSSVISYLFQFFYSNFQDYVVYFAYAFVAFCVFGAISEWVGNKTKKNSIAIILFLFLILSPFLQGYHHPSADFSSLSYAYGTAMVDFLVAILAVGCVILYLSCPKKPLFLTGIIPLIFTKDVGLIFAILGMCVISVFIFFEKQPFILKKLGIIVVGFVFIFIAYGSWQGFVDKTAQKLELENQPNPAVTITKSDLAYYKNAENTESHSAIARAGAEDEDLIPTGIGGASLSNIITSIINPQMRTNRQTVVMQDIATQFRSSKTILLCKDTLLVLLLIALGVATVILAEKSLRFPLLLTHFGLGIGAFAYAFFLAFVVSGFGDGMVEYSRYFTTYYWMWFYIALALFLYVCAQHKYIALGLLSILLVATSWQIADTGLQYTFVSSPQNPYSDVKQVKDNIDRYRHLWDENTVILSIEERFNDYFYNADTLLFYPTGLNINRNFTDFNFTMGFAKEEFTDLKVIDYFNIATDEEFVQIFKENFNYLYISYPQEEFVNSYNHLFDQLKTHSFYELDLENPFRFKEVVLNDAY